MLSGFRLANRPESSYQYFLKMCRSNEKPNELTFAVLISTFLNTNFRFLVPQLHCRVISSGLNLNDSLGSSLMRGYLDLGDHKGVCRVFDEIPVKDIAPWNVLILGYMESGLTCEARRVFNSMPEKNAFSWKIGESAATKIYKLEEDHPAVYSMLCKIHGEREVWSTVTKMKKMIKSKCARKQKAGSWIESA
ncbi:OLC1v1021645C1 [Oldenlandia corymbosa var. corymbosa]|uniref:OLC1v1021645C1 n=1 Tax=Oldenlandia corymbosa var. corymbosa TaxID=529605 RepID=A0AAV1BW43_OLDCO|nr:OLC1v1021645C1 [Oldenlandia corymbosa var. corymbosa]